MIKQNQKIKKTQNKLNQEHMQLTLKRVVVILWVVLDNFYFAETNNVFRFNQDCVSFSFTCFFSSYFLFHFLSFLSTPKNLKNRSHKGQFSTTKSMNKCIWQIAKIQLKNKGEKHTRKQGVFGQCNAEAIL